MATPPFLDLESLLVPIAADAPSGRNLAYEPEYDALREARRSEDDTLQGDWQRKAKAAEWDRVVELGTDAADARDQGPPDRRLGRRGAGQAARLRRPPRRPPPGPGAPGTVLGHVLPRDRGRRPRVAVRARSSSSNNTLPLLIRSIPLTAGFGEEQYSFLRWQESRATDNVGLKNPELMEALIAEGKITGEAVRRGRRPDAPAVLRGRSSRTCSECLAAFKELDQSNDAHFGRDAPGLVSIRKALDDCRRPLEPILDAKRRQEPDPEDEPPAAAEPAPTEDGEPTRSEADGRGGPASPRPRAAGRGPRGAGGPIASVDDAQQRIVEAAAYLRAERPGEPGPLPGRPGAPDGRALRDRPGRPTPRSARPRRARPARPSGGSRPRGTGPTLLEQAEQALGRPRGAGLARRPPVRARRDGRLGDADRSAAASRPAASLLRALPRRLPRACPTASSDDGTPTANAETRAWLRDEILPPRPSRRRRAYDAADRPRRARARDGAGRAADGRPTSGTRPSSWSGAGRVRRGHRADPPRDERRPRPAASGSSASSSWPSSACWSTTTGSRCRCPRTCRQVDEFRLEEWEDEQLSARVWAVPLPLPPQRRRRQRPRPSGSSRSSPGSAGSTSTRP